MRAGRPPGNAERQRPATKGALMMYDHCWQTCRHAAAVAALALVLVGLVGCGMGPASRPQAAALRSMSPSTSTVPENECLAFACEE